MQVIISNKDVADSQQCKDLIKSAQRLAPLGGIFHLAMVLKDTLFAHIVSSSAPVPCICWLLRSVWSSFRCCAGALAHFPFHPYLA